MSDLQKQQVTINLYHLDLILHLQGQVLQYLASQCLHLCFMLGDMQVDYPSFVTNVWPTHDEHQVPHDTLQNWGRNMEIFV